MPATLFDQTRIDFPTLPQQLLHFFSVQNSRVVDNVYHPRSVGEFMDEYARSNPNSGLQPHLVVEICRRLGRQGWMSEVSAGGIQGMDNRYHTMLRNDPASIESTRMIACAVYGFPAVYEHYAPAVLPLINWDNAGDQQIGTCFVGHPRWVITALHCVQPATSLAMRGISSSQWGGARIYSHPNLALDLALILFSDPVFKDLPSIPIPTQQAGILDEVMALGYPNVPGFAPVLAAEAANISGRLAATRGRIAAMPGEIFSQTDLLLITARVRGGFSGGPVLDGFGQAIGVISREPAAEASGGQGHRYDELGYGTAIPSSGVVELAECLDAGTIAPIETGGLNFKEF